MFALLLIFLQTIDADCPATPPTVGNATAQSPGTCSILTTGANCSIVTCNQYYSGNITLTCQTGGWQISGSCSPISCVAGSTWSSTGNQPCTACTTCTGTTCTLTSNKNCTTTATITRSPTTTIYWNDPITFFASILRSSGSPPYPNGTVDFKNGSIILPSGGSIVLNSTGMATYSISNLTVGSNTISVAYGAQPGYSGSSGSVTLSVTAWTSTTTLSYTPTATTSLIYLLPVNLSATITTNRLPPNGTIQFKRSTTILDTIPLVIGSSSSSANLSTTGLLLGSNSISAVYVPSNGTVITSTGTATIIVRAVTITTVTYSPIVDQTIPVNLTATISALYGIPAGSVAWKIGTTTITTTTAVNGVTTLSLALEPGSYSITAQFVQSTQHFGSISLPVLVEVPTAPTAGFPFPATVEGPFTVGCYLQEISPGLAYVWYCPPSSAVNIVLTADTSSGTGTTRVRQFSCVLYINETVTQSCGFVFKPAGYVGPKVLDYLWIGSSTARKYPGVVSNLVISITPLQYSPDQGDCVWWPLWRPPVDFQYCLPGLTCYWKNATDIFIGEKGQCWYPHCTPTLCAKGVHFMQDGYCQNETGSWVCEAYKLAGANCTLFPDGSYGWGIHPVCNPWKTFCLPSPADPTNQTGVCVYSACLDGGCRFGVSCTYPGSEPDPRDECRGNNIPQVPADVTNHFLDQVNPNMTLPLILQNAQNHLQLMARIRGENERARAYRHRHLEALKCSSPSSCVAGTRCSSGVCAVATSGACSPSMGGC